MAQGPVTEACELGLNGHVARSPGHCHVCALRFALLPKTRVRRSPSVGKILREHVMC